MDKIAQIPIGPTFGSRFGQDQGIANLVSIILSNAVALSGVILFIILLVGGVMMVLGAGQNNPETTAKGRKAATAAAAGFAIVFLTYWIVQIVGVVAGLDILNPNP